MKKNKPQTSQSFPSYFAFLSHVPTDILSCALPFSSFPAGILYHISLAFLHLSLSRSTLSSLSLLRVFQGKTHPAPSARPFGAMRRLELWY